MKNQQIYNILTKDSLAKLWIEVSRWGSCSRHVCNHNFEPWGDEMDEFRKNFRINKDEIIIYNRDTSFWGNKNQGCVITDCGIHVIKDNDKYDIVFISWNEIDSIISNVFIDSILKKYELTTIDNNSPQWIIISNRDIFQIKLKSGVVFGLKFDMLVRCSNTPQEYFVRLYKDLNNLFLKVIQTLKNNQNAIANVENLIYQDQKGQAKQIAENERLKDGNEGLYPILAKLYLEEGNYNLIIQLQNEIHQVGKIIPQNYLADFNLILATAYSQIGNHNKARHIYLNLKDELELKTTDGVLVGDFALRQFTKETQILTHEFTALPYEERKAIIVVDRYSVIPEQGVTVFTSQDLPNLSFPIGHPLTNHLYIGHPLIPHKYILFENYQLEFIEDKVREFCQLAQSLGATDISIKCINTTNNDSSNKSSSKIHGDACYNGYSGSGDYSNEYSRKLIQALSKSIDMQQHFTPSILPDLSKDLIWKDSEPSWKRLVVQRMHGNLLTHEEKIETKKSQVLDAREMHDLKLSMKTVLSSLNANVHVEEESHFKMQEDAIISIKVNFAPLSSLTSDTNNCQSENLRSSSNQITSIEQDYLDTLKDCLADCGIISEKERRLLEKIRMMNGISEVRAKELEAMLIPQLTDKEQEYLEEYKAVAEDGIVSEKERRLLDRIRKSYGISEIRAKELESMI